MIGYMRPFGKMFAPEDRKNYRAVYCGLCNSMRVEHGVKSIVFLNYELTSLLYLILSLTEEEPIRYFTPCSVSPLVWGYKYGERLGSFICASAASLLIANYEAEDNFLDDGKMTDKLILGFTEWNAGPIKKKYADFSVRLREIYSEFQIIEKEAAERRQEEYISFLADLSGTLSAEIAGTAAEAEGLPCSEAVYSLIYYWGEWIYLMDAVDDYYDDKRKNKFNPLFLYDSEPCEKAEQLLIGYELYASEWLRELPIRRWKAGIESLFLEQLPKRRQSAVEKMKLKMQVK